MSSTVTKVKGLIYLLQDKVKVLFGLCILIVLYVIIVTKTLHFIIKFVVMQEWEDTFHIKFIPSLPQALVQLEKVEELVS